MGKDTELWRLKRTTAEEIAKHGRFGESRDDILRRIVSEWEMQSVQVTIHSEKSSQDPKEVLVRELLEKMGDWEPPETFTFEQFLATTKKSFKRRVPKDVIVKVWLKHTQASGGRLATEAEWIAMFEELRPYLGLGQSITFQTSGDGVITISN
jgi:hypothetical protein